ncbi:hypothetical protein F4820DRAFT_269975 [Hypoxylon rubiginosum]|uniref:Uncharacterized protein n=1 Tax=Hypoxylon rubiginosum TaxID=110542 RepID=A0ACB9Z4F2_9PEZI|nr:hypothetical protein F4820DRAFT_269975 [Hypoxylon rubiginosum]
MAALSEKDLQFRLKISALLSCFLLAIVLNLIYAVYFLGPKPKLWTAGLGGFVVSVVCNETCRWLVNNELSRRNWNIAYATFATVPLLVRIVVALSWHCHC